MRLVRNTTNDGRCKYALVRLDKIRAFPQTSQRTPDIENALGVLEMYGVLEYAGKNDSEECFVIKLKDRHAAPALNAYADDVLLYGEDAVYEGEVRELARKAAQRKDKKQPD